MDLHINELGITIIVGAFTVLGLEAVSYYFFGKQFTGFFPKTLGRKQARPERTPRGHAGSGNEAQAKEETQIHSMKAAVFIGIAFGIGILAENLSYKFVDTLQTPFKTLPVAISSVLPEGMRDRLGLPSKESSRIRTLIKHLSGQPRIQPLAVELAKNRAFSLLDPIAGANVESWITCKSGVQAGDVCSSVNNKPPLEQEVTRSIYGLYYYAKNRVYAVPEYYDEMKKIEHRRDFSRSISLLAFLSFMVAVVLGLLRILLLFGKSTSYSAKKGQRRPFFFKILYVWVGLFCIHFFGMWAYEREADEFNKRVFGYYSSMLFTEQHKANTSNAAVTHAPNISPTPPPR